MPGTDPTARAAIKANFQFSRCMFHFPLCCHFESGDADALWHCTGWASRAVAANEGTGRDDTNAKRRQVEQLAQRLSTGSVGDDSAAPSPKSAAIPNRFNRSVRVFRLIPRR